MRISEFVASRAEVQVARVPPAVLLVPAPKMGIILLRIVPCACDICRNSEAHCSIAAPTFKNSD